MMQQEQASFEFSENLLLALLDSLYDDRFGTFAFGDNRMRHKHHVISRTTSVFSYILSAQARPHFVNPCFATSEGFLEVGRNPSVSFFASYFLRGHIFGEMHLLQRSFYLRASESTALSIEGLSLSSLFPSALPKEPFVLDALSLAKNEFMALPFMITNFSSLKTLNVQSNTLFEVRFFSSSNFFDRRLPF